MPIGPNKSPDSVCLEGLKSALDTQNVDASLSILQLSKICFIGRKSCLNLVLFTNKQTAPIFITVCPRLLWTPIVTLDPQLPLTFVCDLWPPAERCWWLLWLLAVVNITKPRHDVAMFSAAVTVLTASVWMLSQTINAASFSSYASQPCLLDPAGSCSLYKHHETTLLWHQTAETRINMTADTTTKCLFFTFVHPVFTCTHFGQCEVQKISWLDSTKLFADSWSTVTSFIFL